MISSSTVSKRKPKELKTHMRRAPANATIDQVKVLGGALVGLLAFTHVSVQAASARRHSRRLHCKWLGRQLVLQQVGCHSIT